MEFPFNWALDRSGTRHQKNYFYTSNLKINNEWSLVCLWYDNTPEFLEIRRKSTQKDILVSGNYKMIQMIRNRACSLQRKFTQLIEAGYSSTLVALEYSSASDNYNYPYSISGTLTISADNTCKKSDTNNNLESLLELSRKFEQLLDSKTAYFSDMELICGAVSFSVHKNILSVRSPVFAAMFSTEMKENNQNKVDISDISSDVLKDMLTYIYAGKTETLSIQSAGDLLFAADKYQLQDLKRVCCGYLKSSMTVENVLNTLHLGCLHDKDLKEFAVDFICNRFEAFEVLEETEEWDNLTKEIPSLAIHVLTRLILNRKY